jgi:hypothetical protein
MKYRLNNLFIFLLIISYQKGYSQYSDIDFVKHYNKVGKDIFRFKTGIVAQTIGGSTANTYYYDLSTQNYAGNAGNGTAYVLESLLRMYETTKDKAYLYEFIRHALELQHWRGNCGAQGGCSDLSKFEYWHDSYQFSGHMYEDGLLCWAFSHFVYLVMHENLYNIDNTPLHQFDFVQPIFNHFGVTFNTFHDFANWLRIRTQETLNFYTYGIKQDGSVGSSYWIDDSKCFAQNAGATGPEVINKQSSFGAALFYIGITNPNTDYLHKAAMIALAYKGIVEDQSNCFY